MSQRTTVTIAFCDLVGSTELLNRIGEALNDELRRDLFAALRAPLTAFGGEETKTQGDGLMAAFRGRPSDAVACAIAWQHATVALARRDPSLRLALRVGLSTGEATHEEHDWFGTPVVEAARLCTAAAASQILVSESVRLVVGDETGLGFGSVGALELKGFPDRRAAYAVEWVANVRTVVPRPPGLDIVGATPFAGRRAEYAAFEAALAATDSTGSRTVLVAGPAGIGKTRLVAEVLASSERNVLSGRWSGLSVHQGGAEALRWYTVAAPTEALREVLGADAMTLATAVPSIALRLPELDAPPSAPISVEDMNDAFVRAFGRIAAAAPTVVVFEDLHAASAAGLVLFLELATSRDLDGLLVVGTFRTDERGGVPRPLAVVLEKLADAPGVRRLDLPSLEIADVAAMAVGVEIDASTVHAATGGNPARIVETLRHLATSDDPDAALSLALPFKGLVAFGADDASLFFGRDDAVAALLGRLANDRLIAIVGTSGSGKSSLARAGVAPAVSAGRLAGRWSTCVMTPGSHPLAALASVPRCAPGDSLLVIVDQLEECVTRCHDAVERAQFLDTLVRLIADPERNVRVLATVRADLLGDVAVASSRFAAAVESGTFFLGPMSEIELRAAVAGPAEVAGLRLEPGFVDVVVADVLGQPGALPLLSHALLETWKRRRGPTMTVEHYREAGGARGAIARSADAAFEALDGPSQGITRELFLRLTELGDGAGVEDARRRVDQSEAATLGPSTTVDSVVETLAAARLVTVDDHGIDVAHEALIREWPRLRGWLDDSRDELRLERELLRRADDWDRLGRPESELLRGARLERTIEASSSRSLPTVAAAYLSEGRALRDRESADAARRVRRLRTALASALVLALIATVAGVAAFGQGRRADDRARDAAVQADRAATQAELAGVRRASAEAIAAADANLQVALPLAAETWAIDDRFETRDALLSVLHADPAFVGFLPGPPGGYRSGTVSADGTVGAFAHAGGIDLWNLDQRTLTTQLDAPDTTLVEFLPDGRLAAATAAGVEIWEPTTAQSIMVIAEEAVALAPLTTGLAIGGPNGSLVLVDGDGVEQARATTGANATFVASDGASLLVATGQREPLGEVDAPLRSGDTYVETRDPVTLDVVQSTVSLTSAEVTDLELSPGGRTVGVGTSTSTSASFIDLTGKPLSVSDSIAGIVAGDASRVEFVDATTALVGGVTGRVRVATSGDEQLELQSQVGSVTDLVVSPDGSTAWALGSGAMGWSLDIARSAVRPSDDAAVMPIAISPDGRYVLASEDRMTISALPPPVSDPNEPQVGSAASVARMIHVLDAVTLESVIEPVVGVPIGFIADSRRILVTTDLVVAQILDLDSGSLTTLPVIPTFGLDAPWPVAPDGLRLAHAQPDNSVSILDPRDGVEVESGLGRSDVGAPTSVAYGSAETIAIAYPETSTEPASVVVHRGDDQTVVEIEGSIVTALAVTSAGEQLAVGLVDGSIRLYDVERAAVDGTALVGHTGRVRSVEFHSDGGQLVSTATDGTARVFDIESRRTLGEPFSASVDPGVVYDDSGEFLLLSTSHGPDRVDLDPERAATRACELAGANLSVEAWTLYLPDRTPAKTCPQYPLLE